MAEEKTFDSSGFDLDVDSSAFDLGLETEEFTEGGTSLKPVTISDT